MIMIENAILVSKTAHAAVGQIRKYSGDPYFVHPERVARTVAYYGGSEDQIAAAYMHDVVEDTAVSLDFIRAEFGDAIADIVDDLTDVSRPEDGNRAQRKAIDRDHTASASQEAQFVKAADIIDNSSDIADNDPDFWKVYQKEMLLTLDAMSKIKGSDIWNHALKSVQGE